MIKKIVLENFMSHARTVIEPAPGLTVLVGPNNCGKSAVVEALRAVCENTPTDFMVRHGEKEAVVSIETDDGHTISWHRRKRSASYVIDGVRNDRPEADFLEKVHGLLKLPKVRASEDSAEFDVHFGAQKEPVFLLNETASRRATFFASSSDADRLLQMQRIHRAKVVEDKKEEQKRAARITEFDARLASLSPLDEIAPLLAGVDRQYAELKDGAERVARLEALHARLRHARGRVLWHQAQKEAAEGLLPPPPMRDEESIDRLIKRCRGAQRRLAIARQQAKALASVTPPPPLSDAVALAQLCGRRRMLQMRIRRLSAIARQLSTLLPPAASLDTSALIQRITGLRRLMVGRDRAAARQDRLRQIAEPPAMVESKPVVDLLARLRTAQATVARKQQSLRIAARELAEAQESIEIWARENPVCPVCNGTIDPKRLLSAAGEHVHD